MEHNEKYYDESLDEVFDDIGLEAQERDIHSNKTVIHKELLEADKKRWSIFRYAVSAALIIVTTIGYAYYGSLHTEVDNANKKIIELEHKYANLPPKEFVLGVEKRFSLLENKIDDIATAKQLAELKSELMTLIIKLHAKPGEK